MSVWLMPDLRPFIGGTYFPPRDHGRRPGLKTVLMRIIDQVEKAVFSLYLNFRTVLLCPSSVGTGNKCLKYTKFQKI